MRRAFVSELIELAEQDQRPLLLTADLGFTVLEPFAERFPERFVNVGVAEQNMIGVATGLAEAGYLPFAYSIATFAAIRAYEFIRNGPILEQLPVRVVGVGGGLEYGYNGPSHYALEDVALMRVQPGMTVVVPADAQQARAALRATWDHSGPVYYRLGKEETAVVPGLEGRFELGRAQAVSSGDDLLLVAMGSVAIEAARAAEALAADDVGVTLLVVASVSPMPVDDLLEALRRVPRALTVEEHYVDGGLGSLVAEVVADHGLECRVERCGVGALARGISATTELLRRAHGIDSASLVDSARRCLAR